MESEMGGVEITKPTPSDTSPTGTQLVGGYLGVLSAHKEKDTETYN